MPTFVVEVDTRRVDVSQEQVTVREILALCGAEPERRDALFRTDSGEARFVAPTGIIVCGPAVPTFRLHRASQIRRLTVDRRAWEWGAASISTADICEIAGLPEGTELLQRMFDTFVIIDSDEIDLTQEETPQIFSRRPQPGVETRSSVPAVVNGRPRNLPSRHVSFEDLVSAAFPRVPQAPSRLFTVTYRRGPPDHPEGSLVPSQRVAITSGTIFHVTATDKS
ncbi:hypothetical protein CA234_09870 [Sphingomonas sp. ABOLE]|uniref:multiubiquitin domain-containing protein n=1 Tax=Sphingomonas sp. ABOLE TaxID=1985878 RepID=UPI000F7DDE5E|nr:multiubiquitin domain-containing protein [Sphingomonas sp. ABOLE]RSV41109.1 hypothetical protein CA234_09870 [Sphingomonas sp. ABOLE]